MNSVDVENIIKDIRHDIKEKGYTADMLDFEDVDIPGETDIYYDESEFRHLALAMQRNAALPWGRNIGGGLKGLIKRFIRACISFLITPLIQNQYSFNMSVSKEFSQIIALQDEYEQREADHCREIAELRETVADLKKQIDEMNKK